jgi:hypothetical protein
VKFGDIDDEFVRGRIKPLESSRAVLQIPILSTSPDADVIVAPVVKPGGFRVRVPGHALRDLDASSVRQVVRNARGTEDSTEGVAAYRRLNSPSTARPAAPCTRHRYATFVPAGLGPQPTATYQLPIIRRYVNLWSCPSKGLRRKPSPHRCTSHTPVGPIFNVSAGPQHGSHPHIPSDETR